MLYPDFTESKQRKVSQRSSERGTQEDEAVERGIVSKNIFVKV